MKGVNGVQDVIGIGGIVATIVAAIISGIITWLVTQKSQKNKKLYWYKKRSTLLDTNNVVGPKNMQLLVDGNAMNNPHLLQVKVKHVGNEAISNAKMQIGISGGGRLISSGFENIPYGYGDKWKLEVANEKDCTIFLGHINPKQEVTLVFFVDGDDFEVIFSCPMENVKVQEKDWTKNGYLGTEVLVEALRSIFTALIVTLIILAIYLAFLVQKVY